MKQKNSVIVERRLKIKRLFSEKQTLYVDDVSRLFNVSQLTIRRDFDILAEEGFIERIHGGGRLAARASADAAQPQLFEDKHQSLKKQKQEIAAYIDTLVKDGDTVLLNAGSTTLEVIRLICKKPIVIVTNNAMACSVMDDSKATLISTGGEYSPKSQSYSGLMSVPLLQKINASVCILGVNGISCNEGITTAHYPETISNEALLNRCSGKHIIAADGSKIGRVSMFSSAPLSSVDILVTDSSADPAELKKIKDAGVKVIIADNRIFKENS